MVPECVHVMVIFGRGQVGGSWGNRTSYCLCVCVCMLYTLTKSTLLKTRHI